MKKKQFILLTGTLLLALALTACGGGDNPQEASPAAPLPSSASEPASTQENQAQDQLVLGQQVFESTCSGCHSTGNEKRVGPPLAGISSAVLSVTGQQSSRESLQQIIQQGTSNMPGNMIKAENDLEALLLYLESL